MELKLLCDDESVKLGDINVSAVDDMVDLFYGTKRKNFSGIELWNVAHVRHGLYVSENEYFNANLSGWNTSSKAELKTAFLEHIAYSYF